LDQPVAHLGHLAVTHDREPHFTGAVGRVGGGLKIDGDQVHGATPKRKQPPWAGSVPKITGAWRTAQVGAPLPRLSSAWAAHPVIRYFVLHGTIPRIYICIVSYRARPIGCKDNQR